jgi:hypothetical protein
MPALILQLNTIVQQTVEAASTAGFMSKDGNRSLAYWDRLGLSADLFIGTEKLKTWPGIQFELWKRHDIPLWLCFPYGNGAKAD